MITRRARRQGVDGLTHSLNVRRRPDGNEDCVTGTSSYGRTDEWHELGGGSINVGVCGVLMVASDNNRGKPSAKAGFDGSNSHGGDFPPSTSSFPEEKDDFASWQAAQTNNSIASDDKMDFHKTNDTLSSSHSLNSTSFPSMVDRIPPALVVADQRMLQQEIKRQEDIMSKAGDASSHWYVDSYYCVL